MTFPLDFLRHRQMGAPDNAILPAPVIPTTAVRGKRRGQGGGKVTWYAGRLRLRPLRNKGAWLTRGSSQAQVYDLTLLAFTFRGFLCRICNPWIHICQASQGRKRPF